VRIKALKKVQSASPQIRLEGLAFFALHYRVGKLQKQRWKEALKTPGNQLQNLPGNNLSAGGKSQKIGGSTGST